MSDQQEDLTMYRDLQGQWSGLQDEKSYVQLNRNNPTNENNDIFQNRQDYLIPNQFARQDLYPASIHYADKNRDNIIDGSSSRQSNFNERMFETQNTNFDVNIPQNFGCVDLNNGQMLNANLYNNENQYMLPMNNYERYNPDLGRNMAQYEQRYPVMLDYMPPVTHQHSVEGMPLRREPDTYSQEPALSEMLQPNFGDRNHNQDNHLNLSNAENINSMYRPTFDQPSGGKNPLIDSFLGNWTSNPSGTYTPFGHTFLNVQPNLLLQRETPATNSHSKNENIQTASNSLSLDSDALKPSEQLNRKETENNIFSDTSGGKKRIVAEVKPMRPSYSAVLSKTPKGTNGNENNKKKNCVYKEQIKSNNFKSGGVKTEKIKNNLSFSDKPVNADDKAKKIEMGRKNLFYSQVSSGSESGETNHDFPIKTSKVNNKKGKNDNMNRKWVSLDDLTNDDDPLLEEKPGYNNCDSEFVFVTQPEEKHSAKKKNMKKQDNLASKKNDKPRVNEHVEPDVNESESACYQDVPNDTDKLRRRNKDSKSNSNARKIFAEKNKKNSQGRNKKPKGSSYMGKFQNLLDNWMQLMKNILFWFYNLLSDIFRMSAQLSVDLFSMSCKNTYSWASEIWSLLKSKATSPQWLRSIGNYIDKKIGHTWVGFWRKLKWMKFNLKPEDEKENQKKNNANIPLPATGDDAMKRLLACKGKDPYSILGVGVQCSDDDIKRYYRRQAFLVHPDKNQQPGAEEAFKILQHAFDLIGEPERREAYDRKLVESAHVEAAWCEVSELLAQLHDKVRHAANTIRCTNCSRRHARTLTTRPAYAARYCQQCKIHHAAKEGDIWAESSFWGLVWMYYACMDGAVYQITQWASCQKKNLKHLVANTHHVQYRIVLGNKSQPSAGNGASGKQNFNSSHDANLEDFLNNLYTKAGQSSSGGARTMNSGNQNEEANKNKRKTKKNKV